MFTLNEDKSIYATRGDIVFFSVAMDDKGVAQKFKPGDVVHFKVYGKKDTENVVLHKKFPVWRETEKVTISLERADTKIGEYISKPTDYWYSVTLNDDTAPQTIIGYDEDGAKVFKLFPEGADIPPYEPPKPEDIAIVDDELDMTSKRPVENQAVARAIVALQADYEETKAELNEKVADTNSDVADVAADVAVERARIDNLIAHEDVIVNQELEYNSGASDKYDATITSDGVRATIKVNLREANLFIAGTHNVFIIPDECRPIDVGRLHTEYGMVFDIRYDNDSNRYVLAMGTEVEGEYAPTQAFVATFSYALADYELRDGRVANNGAVFDVIGGNIRDVGNRLDNLTIEGYRAENLCESIKSRCEKVEGHFFRTPDSDMIASDEWSCYIYSVKAGERYRIKTYTVSAGAAVSFMAMEYDEPDIDPAIFRYPATPSTGEIVDVIVTVPTGAKQMLVNENGIRCEAIIEKVNGKKYVPIIAGDANSVLNGKTIVCCGDSITEAVNPAGGYFRNYAEIVAERHNMTCHKDGVGGSTMAYGKGKSFSITRYLNVPAFDYLTIWFGWNDAAYSTLGTIGDVGNETFYGAYKMVLEHLITKNPTKKIGVIVPYGSDAVDPFAQAVRDVSQMYGVPCLDLKNHNKCSLLWGTDNAAQLARRKALTYDGTHPNQGGYDFLATMYEQFLLSL